MIQKNLGTVTIALVFAIGFADFGFCQKFKLPFRRSNSQAQTSRELTIKNGPWLIMCTSFSGENAEQSAMQLANELRRHKLNTYLYRHSFDYSGTVTGLGWQKPDQDGHFNQKPIQMKTANLDVVKEVAVLVGDFPAADDNRAQKALAKIKSLRISAIPELTADPDVNQSTPLRTAFLLPNPLLPEDYFRRNELDRFVIKMNEKIEYSLLKCPGLYSVKVASFRGESIIDPTRINRGETEFQSLQTTGESLTSSRLIDAEEKAHAITAELRRKGVEAYEFHDRNESFVCIGSFDWVTRETNNTVMNNPEIVRIVDKCKPQIKSMPGNPNAILPKSIKGIPFDAEPTPIMVPKPGKNRTVGRMSFLRR